MSVATSLKPAPQSLNLPSHRDPYYAGKWQAPKGGRYVEVTAPGSGESLGKEVDGTAADAEAAIAAAKAAFRDSRGVPPLACAKMLRAIGDVLCTHGAQPALIVAADFGAPFAH